MFDWQGRTAFLRDHPRYNNSVEARIIPKENSNWTASVYHLSPDENRGGHSIFLEVLCKQDDRETFRAINWGWEFMTPAEQNQVGAIFADKPPNEIKAHPIFDGQRIWLEVAGGDRIENIHAMIDPDELASDGSVGNSRHHHSYLVLFQEVDKSPPPPPGPGPDPDPPDPTPNPGEVVGGLQVTVSQAWIASLTPNSAGQVTFFVDVLK